MIDKVRILYFEIPEVENVDIDTEPGFKHAETICLYRINRG